MSRKTSQKRIEANRRNAQQSTGPRTAQGKAKSAANSTTHGFSGLHVNPLAPGCFLQIEDESQFLGLLNEYVVTYNPQHRDELDLLTEGVYAKWRQQRIWMAETSQIETAIAQNESELRKTLPMANAHLANGIAKSEAILKLYLRYDAQLHRHYRNCLKDLRDLQAERLTPIEPNQEKEAELPNGFPSEPEPNEPNTPPKPPSQETETAKPIEPNVPKTETEPIEANLTPEQARLQYMKSEIQRFDDYQAKLFKPHKEPRR